MSDGAKALLTDESSTKEFIALLVEKELFKDALRMVAYLLPKREAVGWGCLCVRHVSGQTKKASPFRRFTPPWNDGCLLPMRRIAGRPRQAADKENPKTPSGLLAMAAFFAGPSMAPPNSPTVPPPDHITSEIVASVVFLAGVVEEPEKAKEKYRVFMQKALALMARMQQPPQQQ